MTSTRFGDMGGPLRIGPKSARLAYTLAYGTPICSRVMA